MGILVVGINHKTAPVEIREKFSFPCARLPEINRLLKKSSSLKENLILSTCNRVEIYAAADHRKDQVKDIENFLSRFHHLDIPHYRQRFYVYRDKQAIEHLFKVASGLDSMVIGEMEILNQVKKAYADAREGSATGKVLNRLFEKAFNTAKRIRTETSITRGSVSVSSVAVRLAQKILGRLRDKKAMIIGAGKVGEQLLLYLKKGGIESILVTNRTRERAEGLAARFAATAVPFTEFGARLAEMDIIITSAGAPHYLISRDDVLSLMSLRKDRPLFIIDLAVPRDVEPGVKKQENVHLYDIDDLQRPVDETYELRINELDKCLGIISASAENFIRWLRSERLEGEEETLGYRFPAKQVSADSGAISQGSAAVSLSGAGF